MDKDMIYDRRICHVLFCRGLTISEIAAKATVPMEKVSEIVKKSTEIKEIKNGLGKRYWLPPVLQLDLPMPPQTPYKPKKKYNFHTQKTKK